MSRQRTAEAAAAARAVNESNLAQLRGKSSRARLIKRSGGAAGNMRAEARKYTFAAALTAGGAGPALIIAIAGTAWRGNSLWLLPAIVQAGIIAVLLIIGRRKTVLATRLAAEFLGVGIKDVHPGRAPQHPTLPHQQ